MGLTAEQEAQAITLSQTDGWRQVIGEGHCAIMHFEPPLPHSCPICQKSDFSTFRIGGDPYAGWRCNRCAKIVVAPEVTEAALKLIQIKLQ